MDSWDYLRHCATAANQSIKAVKALLAAQVIWTAREPHASSKKWYLMNHTHSNKPFEIFIWVSVREVNKTTVRTLKMYVYTFKLFWVECIFPNGFTEEHIMSHSSILMERWISSWKAQTTTRHSCWCHTWWCWYSVSKAQNIHHLHCRAFFYHL